MRFRDRAQAGRLLADRLVECDVNDPVVLGLARGGVPVAVEISARLGAPVEVFVARKIGAPGHEEVGVGAVAEGWKGRLMGDMADGLVLRRPRMRSSRNGHGGRCND